MAALPDAGTKLRLVLDYLPCEACLAQPVGDQELLCSICARLDREVAVRVDRRTTILLEKPTPPQEPVVIPAVPASAEPSTQQAPDPPAPAAASVPEAPASLKEVVVRFGDEPAIERAGVTEVVVEPLAPPAPPPVVEPAPLPAEAELDDFSFDDVATFTKTRDEFFDYKTPPAQALDTRPEPEPQPEPQPEPMRTFAPPPEIPQDDFVFRPPEREAAAREPEPPVVDDIIPEEEVRVEQPREAQEEWAPPPDFLAEEAAAQAEEEILEMEPVPESPPEPEPVEMEVLPDEEEVVETEIVPEPEPQVQAKGDLYRLRGFDAGAESALAKARIMEVSHLSGHDPGDLQQRTGLPMSKLTAWVQVADLVQEVGVPVDAAVALVAAGVAGPKGLRDADPDEVADRAAAFAGYKVDARDVRRWKRRA